MCGYTDGVQKTISERSMDKGLDYSFITTVKDVKDPIEIGDAITDELGEVLDLDGVKSLIEDGYVDTDDGQEIELEDNGDLGYRESWYDVVEGLSEGGLIYYVDSDKETVLGARMGAAGEHIGQVSVWVDTYNQTVSGWGETLPLSKDDCDEINEVLQEIYGD